MSDTTPVAAPAGWYDDPQYPATERWWDGQGWSDVRRIDPKISPATLTQQVVVNAPPKRVNHLLHLILTILTAGLWLPVWIIIALAKS